MYVVVVVVVIEALFPRLKRSPNAFTQIEAKVFDDVAFFFVTHLCSCP